MPLFFNWKCFICKLIQSFWKFRILKIKYGSIYMHIFLFKFKTAYWFYSLLNIGNFWNNFFFRDQKNSQYGQKTILQFRNALHLYMILHFISEEIKFFIIFWYLNCSFFSRYIAYCMAKRGYFSLFLFSIYFGKVTLPWEYSKFYQKIFYRK